MNIARTICLGFLAVIAMGTLLLWFPWATHDGTWNDPLTALFTATSAVCVTGLIVVDTGSYFSFWGQFIILCLIQIGGLGYMMTSTFLMLLIGRKFDLRQKFAIQESFDRPFLQGSNSLVKSIFATTLIFELTGFFLLFRVFQGDFGDRQGIWLAFFHSVSAWNNAGFSLFSDSLMAYHSSTLLNVVITGLIILGGLGYQVIIEMYCWFRAKFIEKQCQFNFSLNFKVVTSTTWILLLGGMAIFLITDFSTGQPYENFSWGDRLWAAWFQSVTTRTAGFNTVDVGQLTIASLLVTMALMFVGASPSGTGGGIKTTTLRILANCTRSVFFGRENLVLYEREVPIPLLLKAVAVVFGSGLLIMVATILIALSDQNQFPLIDILFEVISAFGTVGLSTGITGDLSNFAKVILIFAMYLGRVGVLLSVAALIGVNRPSTLKYPQENLLVG